MRMTAVFAAATLLVLASGLGQAPPRDAYERARLLDDTNQNLAEAIRLYGEVVAQAGSDRALAARAQFRIGVLHERMGRHDEARRAFRTVAEQYPDQPEITARAQARIAGKGEMSLIRRTGPSADGVYAQTFTLAVNAHLLPAIDPAAHRLYVVTSRFRDGTKHRERSRLIVIDTVALSVVKTVPLDVYIDHVVFNPANGKLYATAQAEGRVDIINTTSFQATHVAVPGYPTGIAVNPMTNKIYVTSQGFGGNDKLFVIDGNTGALSAPHDLDAVGGEVVVNPAADRIYAIAAPKTRVFDGRDGSFLYDMKGVAVLGVDPIHNRLYAVATSPREALQILDGTSHAVLAAFGVEVTAPIAIDPERGRVYASVLDNNQIVVIDARTTAEVERILLANQPFETVIDSRTGQVFVCYGGSSRGIGVLAPRTTPPLTEAFSDEFESASLDTSWRLESERAGDALEVRPGRLRIRAKHDDQPGARPLLTRQFRGDHWMLDVKTSYVTGSSGGSRSLFFRIDFGIPSHSVGIARGRDDWNGCCPGQLRATFHEGTTLVRSDPLSLNANDSYVWRIRRDGPTITVERSEDGATFTLEAAHTFGPEIDGVTQLLVLGVNAFAGNDAYVDYDYVRLTNTADH